MFKLSNLTQVERDRFILLGLLPSGAPLARAYVDLFLITWKFILINFTLVDLRRQKFNVDVTWKSSVRRYLSKANSLLFKLNLQNTQVEAGRRRRNREKESKHFSPLGEVDGDSVEWREDLKKLVRDLGLEDS
jgi:hypothetical protein